ncbi:hypothetical protein ACUN0C_07250 [Faunimonas sp. B44]
MISETHGTALVVAAASLVFLLAGAGWAAYGDDLFLSMLMAQIAGCF